MAKFLKPGSTIMDILEHVCYTGLIRVQDAELLAREKGNTVLSYQRTINNLSFLDKYKIKTGRTAKTVYEGVVLHKYKMRGAYYLSAKALPALSLVIPEAVAYYQNNFLDGISWQRTRAIRAGKYSSALAFIRSVGIPTYENVGGNDGYYPIRLFREKDSRKLNNKAVGILVLHGKRYNVYREFGDFRMRGKTENKAIVDVSLKDAEGKRRAILLGDDYDAALTTIIKWDESAIRDRKTKSQKKPLSAIFSHLLFLPCNAEGADLYELISLGGEEIGARYYGGETVRPIFDKETDTSIITLMPVLDIARVLRMLLTGYKPDKRRVIYTTQGAHPVLEKVFEDRNAEIRVLTIDEFKEFYT